MKTLVKEEYYSFNYTKDLSDSPLNFSEIENPLPDDSFSINGNTAHVKVVTKKGYFMKFVSGLSEGDVIEVECEVKNISGVKAKITIDESYNVAGTSRSSVLTQKSKNEGQWEVVKVRYIVDNSPLAHAVVIGTFGGEVSEFYLRKPRFRVFKQVGTDHVEIERTITADTIITKYYDGAMEFSTKKTISNVNVATPWGSLFTSALFDLGTFGVTFIGGAPIVSVIGISDNSSTVSTIVSNAPTSTTLPRVGLLRGTSTSIPNVTFHVTARGRWK